MKENASPNDSTLFGMDPRPGPIAPPSDPRSSGNFDPELFPTANGSVTRPASADRNNERIAIEFLAAYYEINRGWARLRELRMRPDQADFASLERRALEAIEVALRRRDELEDHYAPLGVVAEPFSNGGMTTDVHFTFGSTRKTGRFRSQPVVFTAEFELNPAGRTRRRKMVPPGPPLTNATVLPES